MPLDPHASVGHNIAEFHTGKTFAHTADKFGKDRADKQAVAVALHTKDEAGDHKAAVAKMHPEHLHKLVQAAHEGKFGSEAQKMAEAAHGGTQPPQQPQDAQPAEMPQQPGRTLSSKHIFGRPGMQAPPQGGDGMPEEDDQQPTDARGIFGRR